MAVAQKKTILLSWVAGLCITVTLILPQHWQAQSGRSHGDLDTPPYDWDADDKIEMIMWILVDAI